MGRPMTGRKFSKYITIHISNKEILSRIYTLFPQLNNRKTKSAKY